MVSEIKGGYAPTANDDTDNNVFLTVRTGNYATSFTISGNVGATGDVIIITEIYAQIVLRAHNSPDSLNTFPAWELIIREKGMITVTSRHVTIDGSSKLAGYYAITSNGYKALYTTSTSSDLIVSSLIFTANDAPEVTWHAGYLEDIWGYTIFLYINIIIMGA